MYLRRNLLCFLFLVALSASLLSACAGSGAANQQPTPTALPTPKAAAKPTFTVKKGDISAQVQFSARVVPAVQQELFFRASGRIRKVYVRNGQEVKQGEVLADLLQLNEMESQKRQQDLDLRKAEIALEMAWLRQQLAATQTPNYASNYDIEMKMKEYEVELAQIALEETKLGAQNLDTAIADSQITSPIDGRILNMSLIEGSEVRAFQTLVTVGDPSKLEVGATLTSTQMQELSEGMQAEIELPNRPGERLQGVVRSLPYPYGTGGGTQTGATSNTTSTTGAAVDTSTRVEISNPEAIQNIKLGDLVNVTVIRESKQNVLWIPSQAIRTFEGRNFVVIQTEGLPRRQDVKVGIKNGEQVEILEGLEEGQVVIAP